jgi:hypothetical protein
MPIVPEAVRDVNGRDADTAEIVDRAGAVRDPFILSSRPVARLPWTVLSEGEGHG